MGDGVCRRRTRRAALALGVAAGALAVAAGGAGCERTRRPAGPPPDGVEAELRAAVAAAPLDPRPRLALIAHLGEEGRAQDARDEAEAAFRAFPESVPVRAALGAARLATARGPEAVEALRPLAGVGPPYRLQLAATLVRLGRREEAAATLRAAKNFAPADAVRAAEVYLDALRFEEAARQLEPLDRDPRAPPEAAVTRGLALLLAGRYRQAAAVLERAAAGAPGPAVLHYLGSALRLSGDPGRLADAERWLASAAEADPENGLAHHELALARRGLLARRRAGSRVDWSDVAAPLERAAALAPDLAEIQRDLAEVRERQGRAAEAAVLRARSLRILHDPRAAARALNPIARRDSAALSVGLELAAAWYEAGDAERSGRVLAALLQRHPQEPAVLWELALLERRLERFPRAQAWLDRLERIPGEQKRVLSERGALLETLAQTPEAAACARRLIALEGANATWHYRLGAILVKSGDAARRAEAEASLRRALELNPDLPAAHRALAQVLRDTGRLPEAIRHLRRALDLAPADVDTLRLLGGAYQRAGRRAEAEDALRLFQRLWSAAQERERLSREIARGRNARAARERLYRHYLARGNLARATVELEALAHLFGVDPPTRRLLAALLGHGRRFQRQVETASLTGGRP